LFLLQQEHETELHYLHYLEEAATDFIPHIDWEFSLQSYLHVHFGMHRETAEEFSTVFELQNSVVPRCASALN
jgi:hypothetical protein